MARSTRFPGGRTQQIQCYFVLFFVDVYKLQGPSGVIGSTGKPGVQGPPGNTGSQERD